MKDAFFLRDFFFLKIYTLILEREKEREGERRIHGGAEGKGEVEEKTPC